MEPGEDRQDEEFIRKQPAAGKGAAMEPGEDRQDEGSRILGPLTWEDAARRERPVYPLCREPLFLLSSFDKCTVSCVRAIPGI